MEGIEVLDTIKLNLSEGNLWLLNIVLGVIMFGVALEIKIEHFKNLLKNPKPAIVGAVSQIILLPAITFLFVYAIQPSPSVALGLILVGACPGGNISNFISALAKGNVALSVSLTAISTLLAVIATPFNFAFYAKLYSKTAHLAVPITINFVDMLTSVLIILGIPLMLGMLFSSKFPNVTKKIIRYIKIFSILAFAGFVAVAFSKNLNIFTQYIHLIFVYVLIHNALGFASGYYLGKIFRLSFNDCKTIAIETGIQNSGLGLVLILTFFNGLGGMAIVAAWWGIWHVVSGMGLAYFWHWRHRRMN